jgi:RHS repeat-associated protein
VEFWHSPETVVDAEVPSYAGSLSVGRSHTSLAGPVAGPAGVFGPGWTADFTGPDAGAGDLTVTDATTQDGAFFLTDPEGETVAFVHETLLNENSPDDPAERQEGTYLPVGEYADSDDRLTLTSGAPSTLTLLDGEGTKTVWKHRGNGEWAVDHIIEPYQAGTTRYVRDPLTGRVTRIIAPNPPGVDCEPSTDPTVKLDKGCRSLVVTYAESTTQTAPGDHAGRISTLEVEIWDPEASAGNGDMVRTAIAQYAYDSDGRLVQAWDPRLPDLKTTYTYQAVNVPGVGQRTHLKSVTAPGKATHTLTYDTAQRVTTVEAKNAAAGTSLVNPTRIHYDVPLTASPAAPGIPDLTLATTSTWGQGVLADPANGLAEDAAAAPSYATAVFGPNYTDTAGAPGAWPPGTEADWQHAAISYTNARGWATNNAAYGAGAWQIDATVYHSADPTADTQVLNGLVPGGEGAVAWSISEGNLAIARAVPERTRDLARELAEISYYEYADPAVPTAGTRLKHTLGVSRDVVLDSGEVFHGRVLTTTTYDEGAPALPEGQTTPYGLETSTTTAVVRADLDPTADGVNLAGERRDARTTRTGYSPNVPGDGDGWAQRTPTRTITPLSPGNELVERTRFDGEGKVFATTLPGGAVTGGAGTDAATTVTTYYTAAANPTYPTCGNKAEWAGLVCRTAPKAQPAGTAMPVAWTTDYTWLLEPATVVETDGAIGATNPELGVLRTTTTDHDSADRPETVTVTSAVAGDTPVGAKTTAYDPVTGEARTVTVAATAAAPASVITTCTDLLGRTTYYGTSAAAADCASVTATTTYDTAGRVATSNDGKGTYTYTYDGTDLDGKRERRGLVTALIVSELPTGTPDTFRAAYDPDGNLARQQYPNGITATWTRDPAGDETALHYRRGTDPITATVNGTPIVLDFSQALDAHGRVRVNYQPASAQTYTYDPAARLTRVVDVLGAAYGQTCQTREYEFDGGSAGNSNRTKLTTRTGAPTGADGLGCDTTASTPTATTSVFDTADRITNPGYTYDALGRTHTLPATDVTGGQNLSVGYHANDMVRTQTTGTSTTQAVKTYALDAADRIATVIDTLGGAETRRITNHYTDSEDSPAVIDTTTTAGGTTTSTWTRHVTAPSGDLALIQDSTGTATLQLANLHGDITATIPNHPDATTAGAYFEHTEYGQPRNTNPNQPRYSWLGAKTRSTDTLAGLILMGVRLYNPTTGRFLSIDPIEGGSCNAYEYTCADPINNLDLDGRAIWVHICIRYCYKGGKAAGKAGKAAFRWVRKKTSGCRSNSFVPGTPVLMADGTAKPIEDVEIGDFVLANSPETGETAAEEVTDLILGEGLKELVKVGIDSELGATAWVTATEGHPFYARDSGWIDAEELEIGNLLVADDADAVAVIDLRRITQRTVVHNLTVNRIHTYFVLAGEQPVLVHNASCPVHGHDRPKQSKGKKSKGQHQKGNARRKADQARSNNVNKQNRQADRCNCGGRGGV